MNDRSPNEEPPPHLHRALSVRQPVQQLGEVQPVRPTAQHSRRQAAEGVTPVRLCSRLAPYAPLVRLTPQHKVGDALLQSGYTGKRAAHGRRRARLYSPISFIRSPTLALQKKKEKKRRVSTEAVRTASYTV